MNGHSRSVTQVEFSDDGKHFISGSIYDIRFWDTASGRQVRQMQWKGWNKALGEWNPPPFAFKTGDKTENKRDGYVFEASDDMLQICRDVKEVQRDKLGTLTGALACFKAPQNITNVRSHGAAICVACAGGAVCFLTAPFLTA